MTSLVGIVEGNDGRLFKSFHGMSSSTAMERHYGEIARHRAPEGKAVKFHTEEVFQQQCNQLGGVRSSCSYVGARRIKDLPKCTTHQSHADNERGL